MAARGVGAYAAVRQQFGTPIGRFEGIEEPLARIAGTSYLLDAARVFTCGAVDSGQKPAVVSAILKYQATEALRRVVTDGMDVLGGAGLCVGPRNLIARGYMSAPIGITVEGANILTRTLIVYGQGAIRCHPYAQQEIRALAGRRRRRLRGRPGAPSHLPAPQPSAFGPPRIHQGTARLLSRERPHRPLLPPARLGVRHVRHALRSRDDRPGQPAQAAGQADRPLRRCALLDVPDHGRAAPLRGRRTTPGRPAPRRSGRPSTGSPRSRRRSTGSAATSTRPFSASCCGAPSRFSPA